MIYPAYNAKRAPSARGAIYATAVSKSVGALIFFCVAAIAQTTPATSTAPAAAAVPVPAPSYPAYMLMTGAGYTRQNGGASGIGEGWVSGAYGLGGGNYIVTTVDMFSSSNSIRTGYAKLFSSSGNWKMGARVDAGISTTAPIIGSFSGGAFMLYDLKGIWERLAGLQAVLEVRVTGATAVATSTTTANGLTTTTTTTAGSGSQVTPGFYFGFGKTF